MKHAEKDVTSASNGNAFGIDLVDSKYFAFAFKKLSILLSGVSFILSAATFAFVRSGS